MKKLLYFGMAFGVLLFVLVIIGGALVVYQRLSLLSLPDDVTFCSTRLRGDFVLTTEDSVRKFQVIEVVCKRKIPFNATLKLRFHFLEGEREFLDGEEEAAGSQSIRIDLPERPAKNMNGVWTARFYLLGANDGAIGVFDAFPTQETFHDNPEILDSLVPYNPPQQNIIWDVSSNRNADFNESNTGDFGASCKLYGYDGTMPRVQFFLGGRPLTDAGEF